MTNSNIIFVRGWLTDWVSGGRAVGKTRRRKITFSTQWPPWTDAEGGLVEPVLLECC